MYFVRGIGVGGECIYFQRSEFSTRSLGTSRAFKLSANSFQPSGEDGCVPDDDFFLEYRLVRSPTWECSSFC